MKDSLDELAQPIPAEQLHTTHKTVPTKRSLNQEIHVHEETIRKTKEAQQRLEVMKSYGVEEHVLADQMLVNLAHEPIEEHEKVLAELKSQKAKQKADRIGVLKSILSIFKPG